VASSGGLIRLSDIKVRIYHGLRFERVFNAGWSFPPSPGIVAADIKKMGLEFESYKVPLTTAIKTIMMPSIRKNFDVGGRPEPGWEPLAEFTIAMRGGSAWPILVRSGNLKKTASSFQIWSIGQTSATIRQLPSRVWYGNLHQEGYGSIGGIARRMLGSAATPASIQKLSIELASGRRPASQQTKFTLPQREFALFQEEDIEKIQEIFIEWMEEKVNKAGRAWTPRF
jgi:phage gpG-like protein